MRINRFLRLGLFGLSLFLGTSGFAAEHWDVYTPALTPWSAASAIASFNGKIIVAGRDAQEAGSAWSSTDGIVWTPLNLPPFVSASNRNIVSFREHNGELYGFMVEFSTGPGATQGYRYVIRTSDGIIWSEVTPWWVFGIGSFSDAISYNGNLFVGDFQGRVWRTNGVGATVQWTPLSTGFGSTGSEKRTVSFAEESGFLYAACAIETVFFSVTQFFKTQGIGNSWTQMIGPGNEEVLRPGNTKVDSTIYWSGTYLQSAPTQALGTTWTRMQAGILPVPFSIRNQLHVVGPSSQVLAFNNLNQTWTASDMDNISQCATNVTKYGHSAVLGNSTYLLPCNLIKLTEGINSVRFVPSELTDVVPQQKGVLALQISLDVNFEETLNAMRVVNVGSAESLLDIEKVTLVRQGAAGPETILFEMLPGTDGKSWTFPPGLNVAVTDGNEIKIKVDLTPTARIGKTIQFVVGGGYMSFQNNPTFNNGRIVSSGIRTILAVASAPEPTIEKFEIYPNPARDSVRFLYTLEAQADVKVQIFDRSGRVIEEINEVGKMPDNRAVTEWNASDVAPGVYYVHIRITGASGQRTHKSKVVIER